MHDLDSMEFATKQIHSDFAPDQYGALVAPIYMTSTYNDPDDTGSFKYTRAHNPSINRLEQKVAMLENGQKALACASGMGAISTALFGYLSAGDEAICSDTVYGCTFDIFSKFLPRFGITTALVDFTNIDAILEKMTEKTKVVYMETPCNPTMKIIDIKAVADAVHKKDPSVKVYVDNTFCSPYITRPLTLGADVVVHSATKYINGHGDVLAGFVISDEEFIKTVKPGQTVITGSPLSPMSAFLIERGLKTLDMRMHRHSENAMALAKFLEAHPKVSKVRYPGLESFEGHDIAAKQMALFGGMMSADLKASREEVKEFLKHFNMCGVGASLGDAETLVQHPASGTHKNLNAEELAAVGIGESMIRISCGLEASEDIINDFKRALDTI